MTFTRDENYRGPLLGAMLRLAHRAAAQEIERRLAAAGYGDIQVTHYPLTQALYGRPEGMRTTELAAYARITKQAMKEVVDAMAARGYVERVPHPTDGRAQLVRFTERGWTYAAAARTAVLEVEKVVAERLGEQRMRELLASLQGVIDVLAEPHGEERVLER